MVVGAEIEAGAICFASGEGAGSISERLRW